MYEIIREDEGRAVGIRARGQLTGDDLDELSAYLDRQIEEHGTISMLFEMDDFEGWEADAFFKDLKFDITHNADVERVAMVGDEAWEQWMARLMEIFAHAEVQFYNRTHLAEAWAWVRGKV